MTTDVPESRSKKERDPKDVSFGANIKRLRKILGKTQDTIAISLGVHKVTYAGWEQGRIRPSGLIKSVLATKIFKVSLSVLEKDIEQTRVGLLREVTSFEVSDPNTSCIWIRKQAVEEGELSLAVEIARLGYDLSDIIGRASEGDRIHFDTPDASLLCYLAKKEGSLRTRTFEEHIAQY